ncbi:MucR family transcriptional regulator [Methylorubrum extorquens]|uniref:Transcriptional regulator, MucR family n=1 Tax=Methylorubrum extorquens (strain CM4 / NCIMB 13688) TaxID=440085 RepID=B7L1S4_METC4|nr:MucR family transcriptional regulator [Methylorubrum extorquens]ACK81468.1 transcriptional regulator, MucR family [Methylorubrum extorquens CM4]
MFRKIKPQGSDLIELAGEILSAYVTRNHVSPADIPRLLCSVHAALTGLANGHASTALKEEMDKPTPEQVRKSITPDALISFIDGKPYKTLKRHLSAHGLDPYSYCQRYGLPNDYPMVAAAYAARRSELAKSIGLRRPGAMADGKNLEESGRKGRRTDQRTKLSDIVRSTKRSQMAG